MCANILASQKFGLGRYNCQEVGNSCTGKDSPKFSVCCSRSRPGLLTVVAPMAQPKHVLLWHAVVHTHDLPMLFGKCAAAAQSTSALGGGTCSWGSGHPLAPVTPHTTVGESRRKILLMSSRLSAGLRRLLAKHTPALLGMQSTVWGVSHMLPSGGVRVWVVYLTPKIERIVSLLSASPVGEARCRCRKVWLTRIDYYYYTTHNSAVP
jgi:hypothetical protein